MKVFQFKISLFLYGINRLFDFHIAKYAKALNLNHKNNKGHSLFMKKNLPVTQVEESYSDSANILSTTNLKGAISYVNDDFIKISGFTEDELIGKNHNMVRHPDMPPAAFEDLWSTVKSGNSWMGMVKNRCKNGNHY